MNWLWRKINKDNSEESWRETLYQVGAKEAKSSLADRLYKIERSRTETIAGLQRKIHEQKRAFKGAFEKAAKKAEPPIVERLARENERRQRDQALVRIVRAVQALPTVTAIHAAEHFERLVAQIARSHAGES